LWKTPVDDDLVTIRRFHFLGEAEVARGFLESAGISCFVTNRITASHHACFSGGVGAVCLQVRSRDIHSAQELLEQADSEDWQDGDSQGDENSRDEATVPEDMAREFKALDSRRLPVSQACPSCSSGRVSVKRTRRECLNCGYQW
jgi:hypothetical protein